MFMTPTQSLSRTGKEYAREIKEAWQEALDSILEVCRILVEAKDTLEAADYNTLINAHLPFTRRTAERLVRIGVDKRLTAKKHRKVLPPHWGSLYELTQLDDDSFDESVDKGEIFADMERKDVTSLVQLKKEEREDNNKSRSSGRSSASMTHTIVESDAKGRQRVASVYSDKEMANWQLVELEKALQAVCDKHHVKAEVVKSTSDHQADREARKKLAAEVDAWLEKRKKSYNKGIDENELSLLRDVLYQHENEKAFLNTNDDGTFDDNDIRNPDNPYFGWSKGEIYDYCRQHQILTQYSNFESIDFEAFIESLVLAHCKGNPKQREEVHRTLVRRSKSPKRRNAKLAQKALARLIV